jgi:hypothetical protein
VILFVIFSGMSNEVGKNLLGIVVKTFYKPLNQNFFLKNLLRFIFQQQKKVSSGEEKGRLKKKHSNKSANCFRHIKTIAT